MGLLGDIIGIGASLLGNKADKKKNKRADAELALQKDLAAQQKKISDYIQGLSEQLMKQGSGFTDPYGGTAVYDPVTGTYKSTMGAVPTELQRVSDKEEAARLTIDQAMRRGGLQDEERQRQQASREADIALGDLSNFERGIGRVDPATLAAQIRSSRLNAVNAGYDDAERAASKLQLRTGSSAVTDALGELARERVRAQAQIGDPETEALLASEEINRGRLSDRSSIYDLFSNKAKGTYDAAFSPAPYAEIAAQRGMDAGKFDLGKYEVAQGGSGTAAAGIGSSAAGLRQAYQLSEANRVHAPNAKLWAGIGSTVGGWEDKLAKIFSGGMG